MYTQVKMLDEVWSELVALPVQHFDAVTMAIQENNEHGVEHGHFNIQLHERGQAIGGFSKAHRFGVWGFRCWLWDAIMVIGSCWK